MALDGENEVLFGLRSPLKDSKAIVIRIEAPNQFFANGATAREVTLALDKLIDLGGMGIRGMCRDEMKGYWIFTFLPG